MMDEDEGDIFKIVTIQGDGAITGLWCRLGNWT